MSRSASVGHSTKVPAWIGATLGVPGISFSVDGFGQPGTIADLPETHDSDVGCIVNAALSKLT